MKLFLDRILVVEGKEDASYLSNYIESEIVQINGYEMSEKIISYLKNKPVIIFTDPDSAGLKIRNKLNSLLNDVVNIEIDIKKCTRGDKDGVAECEIDEILSKLSEFCKEKALNQPIFSTSFLYSLGLTNNKKLRDFVCSELNLGPCNFKTLHKRLNINGIKENELIKIIEKYKYGNK